MDGISGTIKAGDFIKFANHTKVYMCTADFTNSGTMTIEPGLSAAVADNEVVTFDDVPFQMRLARDVQEFRIAGLDQYIIEVDLIEAV
jgi:hypothetical protein